MKKYLFLILFASLNSNATGYSCRAYCLVLDSANSTLYFMGEKSISAGTSTAKEAHELLRKSCQREAGSRGILVDTLDFKSSVESESSGGSQSAGSASVSFYRGYRLDVSRAAEYSSYWNEYENREIDIRLTPSFPKIACELDEEIETDEIPYEGSIDIQ